MHASFSGVDMEVARALLEVGVLPAMVTPIVDPAVGFSMTPATYPVSPVPMMPLGLSADSTLLPAPLTPSRMAEGLVVPGSVVSSPAGGTDVAGGHQRLPDLSLEGPFDVHQDRPVSGASPRVLDGMRGCQYRMTLYDQDSGGPHFSPAYGIQLLDPRLLEYVVAPESARLLSRSPEYWLHHLGHEKTPSVGRRFRRMPCSRWCRHTGFVGRLIIWRPWDCGSRLVLKEFGDPCRQRHAMPACRAVTVSQIYLSDSMDSM